MIKHALLIASLSICVAACGGKKKGATTTPDDQTSGADPTTTDSTDNSGSMVSPDTMDEITRRFQRKGTAVSRCLAMAVDNKELPKNSHGKITLGVTIGTAGKVDDVKIIKQTLEGSKSLDECVLKNVREIEFPQVPKPYETTYTYAFEAV
ncbi:MAG TPA: AgmX/PglI C-terminal domain-containing protein [Kofleriaceae bacterium]|nr:AgmX/PglI C-terminal domain-containing protein [Kofleriaceae bacterium]